MSEVNSIDIKDWSEGIQESIRQLGEYQVKNILSKYINALLPLIEDHTPVSPMDEHQHDPNYVHAVETWEAEVDNSRIRIYNAKPYGIHLEVGSIPGQDPWPTTGGSEYKTKDRRTGKIRVRRTPITGRTVRAPDLYGTLSGHAPGQPRIWAGNKNPGGGRSVGGAVSRAHMDLRDKAGVWPLISMVQGGTSYSAPVSGASKTGMSDDVSSVVKANILTKAANAVMGGSKATATGVKIAAGAMAGDFAGIVSTAKSVLKRIFGR